MFGVKSVAVVGSVLSSGGVLSPPVLWCEVCLYEHKRGSSLCVMLPFEFAKHRVVFVCFLAVCSMPCRMLVSPARIEIRSLQ